MNEPDLSVILPVYNEPVGIRATLSSLFRQTLPYEQFEILVVDNGSSDQTPEVVSSLLQRFPGSARIVKKTHPKSSYAARNKGIKQAQSNWIAFIDADMTVDPTWLEQIYETVSTTTVDYLACNVEVNLETETVPGIFNKHIMGFPVKDALVEQQYAPTACLVVRRSVFHDVGLFDERLFTGGDQEFGKRVHHHEYNTSYAPEIVMHHPARSTFRSLVSKCFRTGRGDYLLNHFHPELFPNKQRRLCNFRYVLPPAPSKFDELLKRKGGDNQIDLSNRFGCYLLLWVQKVVRHAGYVFETFRHS